MLTIQEVVQPKSLGEAYEILNDQKNNVLLGGCTFLRLGSRNINKGIDLTELGLDYVKELDNYIEIGALTTFRELETNPLLTNNFNGVLSKAVGSIIGVQFRNSVKVGASVYSKYGFSNLITALLVLDTEVELYKAGRMSLNEFLNKSFRKDILTRIFIKKDIEQVSYQDLRNSASDFAILNAAVSKADNKWTIAVGARPQRATIAEKTSQELSNYSIDSLDAKAIDYVSQLAAQELTFGSNKSAKYREAICKVLVKRAITEVLECK